jgi:predicted nucleotidyltransferase
MKARSIDEVREVLEEIKKHLKELYGDKIKRIIVYGSFARGEAGKESDIDVLVVTSDDLDPYTVRKSISDTLFKILLRDGELISLISVPESVLKSKNTPFIQNVKEEGVSV